MAKLIQLQEAAEMLGMTPDELNALRSRGEIHGYRDGSTWKFKESEIERLAKRSVELEEEQSGDSSLLDEVASTGMGSEIDSDLNALVDVSDLQLDDEDTDGPDSVLVSDEELGSSPSASSTVIGKSQLTDDPSSDLLLPGEPQTEDRDGETAIGLAKGGSGLGSEIDLESITGDASGSSTGKLADAADGGGMSEGSELNLVPDSSTQLAAGSDILAGGAAPVDQGSATGELGPSGGDESAEDIVLDTESVDVGESLNLSDDELEISLESSSEINLGGSDLNLAPSDTNVSLSDPSKSDSDVTLGAGDSGINLGSPTDSGISLEQTPPEIAVDGEEALELGDAELIGLEDDDEIQFEDADQLQADADFLLTPVEADANEEGDSGSQVIALDTEELDEEDATLLQDAAATTDESDPDFATLPDEQVGIETPAAAGVPGMAVPEAPYSIWNVLGLGLILLPLGLTGLMVVDLARNIWSWNGAYPVNSGIMDFIVSLFGG